MADCSGSGVFGSVGDAIGFEIGPNSASSIMSSSSNNNSNNNCPALITASSKSSTSSQQPVVDRFKLLYANVNEEETPLPRSWSPQDKCNTIGLTENNLRVHYKGIGKSHNDAASVRTAHPIPATCGLYYFEVKIISKGRDGYMGIGLTAQNFKANRLPGWDRQSYGYHGDDGNSFSSSGAGKQYGPTFTTGDIIGCGVNMVDNTCFYTKNGHHLGIAFRDLPAKLYPTVGLQTPGEVVDANFGQEPFKFDIEDMHRELRTSTKMAIHSFPIPPDQGDLTIILQKIVQSYLVHHGYSATAESFAKTTGQTLSEDLPSIKNRQRILNMVMSGRMGSAIEQTIHSYPGLLENNQNLMFMLKCRQFIEMVNGCDFDSPVSRTSPVQTSVIQSTKSYQNGSNAVGLGGGGGGQQQQNGAGLITDHLISSDSHHHHHLQENGKSNNSFSSNNNNVSNNNNNCSDSLLVNSSHPAPLLSSVVEMNLINSASSNTNNSPSTTTTTSSSSSSLNLNSAGGGGGHLGGGHSDYLNDVEMENGHSAANGSCHKNGSSENNISDSLDGDEVMDVDPAISNNVNNNLNSNCSNSTFNESSTLNHHITSNTSNGKGSASGSSSSNSKSGVERMLEFGRELFQMSQRLEKENGPNEANQKMLEDAFSLLAYSNPWSSPLGWQLCPSRRETVCAALNSAILGSMNYPVKSPLAVCISHGYELLRQMARSSLGACAFVDEVIRYH